VNSNRCLFWERRGRERRPVRDKGDIIESSLMATKRRTG
jgi:hypothetical protein